MYIVQTKDLFNFRDVFASNHPQVAFEYMKGLESIHGKMFRIIKQQQRMDNLVLRTGENMACTFKDAAANMKDYAVNIRKVFPLNKKG